MSKRPEDVRMPLGDHLEELRARIIISLVVPFLLLVPTFIFGARILDWLLEPLRSARAAQGLTSAVQVLSASEPFISYIKIAILTAFLGGLPVALWQAWKFISPGLYEHERRFGLFLVPSSLVLVILGVSFNYYLVLPMTLRMFILFGQTLHPINLAPPPDVTTPPEVVENFGHISEYAYDPPELAAGEMYYNSTSRQVRLKLSSGKIIAIDTHPDSGFRQEFEIKSYMSMALGMMVAFGIAFQLPLVILLLGWMGLVEIAQLRRVRKYALLGCTIAAAILTPPDVTSQIAMLIPLYGLYELSILLLWAFPASWITKRRDGADGE